MSNKLYTPWGKRLNKEAVLTEYPRPHMIRDSYVNLNGLWSYAFRQEDTLGESFDGVIMVPFSPEATLSGVNRQLQPEEYLHYRRSLEISDNYKKGHVLLHFGAVDQICTVYINRKEAGKHEGGYLPFVIDITDFVRAGSNELSVIVKDYSDTTYRSRGKQKLKRGGMFYTAQSGIWQTVWMEYVEKNYIEKVKLTPCYDDGEIEIKVFSNGRTPADVKVSILEKTVLIAEATVKANQTIRMEIKDFKSWTPESPCLYDVIFTMGNDKVQSYFAMRKYSVGTDAHGIRRFLLNNKPYFHNGLLDQGYWPDGLYTAPSEEALKYDICKMKELGFNTIRKHIKVEPARWYYHCDTIGMLVWQDMMNGGSEYNMNLVGVLPNVCSKAGRLVGDGRYRALGRLEEEGRKQYYRELKDMVAHLYNFPCIAVWVPFNEGWGQFDAKKATALVRRMDGTRFIDEASGWFDQGGGDMYSIHNYWRKLKVRPCKKRVVALTEYGGYSFRMEGHSYCREVYGYRKYHSSKELTAAYRALLKKEIIANIRNGLSAAIYTQLSDVEEEVNGILTYDRRCVKLNADEVISLNREVCDFLK